MNLAKRSMLALISFVFMLTIVGYINYKYDPEREKDLGQTVYVSSQDDNEYDVSIYSEEDKIRNLSSTGEEDSIAVFKYDRDNMFSELIETYNNIINNGNTSADNINSYQEKLNALIEKKTLINMVENVIKSKGIEDIVIIPTNNDNLNVVVKSDVELEADMIAKIQQIIVDQLGVDASKLSITRSEK
ncbi:MAG: SpoIIIAH-like family protein [Clostridia bacterium]|nr:SpoIIIAH-like family protein [Clostridia bacterium]